MSGENREVRHPLCFSHDCKELRLENRPWCKKHDTCEFCDQRAVEGRHAGKPRCLDHSETNEYR